MTTENDGTYAIFSSIIENEDTLNNFINSIHKKILRNVNLNDIQLLTYEDYTKRVRAAEEYIEDKTLTDEIDVLYSLYCYNKYIELSNITLKDKEDYQISNTQINNTEAIIMISYYNSFLKDCLKEITKETTKEISKEISKDELLKIIIKCQIQSLGVMFKIISFDDEKKTQIISECLEAYKGLYAKIFERYYNMNAFPYAYIYAYDKNMITDSTISYIDTVFKFFGNNNEEEE